MYYKISQLSSFETWEYHITDKFTNTLTEWEGQTRKYLAQGHDLQTVSTVRFFKFPLYARVHWSYAKYLLSNNKQNIFVTFRV